MIRSIEEVLARLDTIIEIKDKLVYDHFTVPQELPFAAYTYDFATGGADDYKGIQWIDFTLELYTETRDINLERKIITVLDDVEITSSSVYIDTERMYDTSFRFRFPFKLTSNYP